MGLERLDKILIGTTVGGLVLLILGCVLGFAVFPVLIEDQLIEVSIDTDNPLLRDYVGILSK